MSKSNAKLTRLMKFLLFMFLSHSGIAFSAQKIVFTVDESPYCPYTNCDQGRAGFIVDIVKEIYTTKNYTVIIKSLPWKRAIQEVQLGNAEGLLGLTKSSAPKLTYPKEAVAKAIPAVFTLKNNSWQYQDVHSFNGVRLGLIQGYGYSEISELDEYLKSPKNQVTWLAGENALLKIFKMIKRGRIDATIDDLEVGK